MKYSDPLPTFDPASARIRRRAKAMLENTTGMMALHLGIFL